MRVLVAAAAVALLTGCASRSSEVTASYVSSLQYQNHTCLQLGQEAESISSRAVQLSGAQDSKATRDAVATTVGVVVFWPLLFAVRGDDNTTAELARMKGEMEAIERVSVQKNCGIKFQREPV
jgi:hypothetical protein